MISVSLTSDEQQTLDNAFAMIESVITKKFISLTPDERKCYSQVSDKTEDWIGKTKAYMAQNPSLVLSHIDVTEFNADFDARQAILPRMRRLESIFNQFEDTSMLLGSDLYHNAITYYKGLKAAAATDAPGQKLFMPTFRLVSRDVPAAVKPPKTASKSPDYYLRNTNNHFGDSNYPPNDTNNLCWK